MGKGKSQKYTSSPHRQAVLPTQAAASLAVTAAPNTVATFAGVGDRTTEQILQADFLRTNLFGVAPILPILPVNPVPNLGVVPEPIPLVPIPTGDVDLDDLPSMEELRALLDTARAEVAHQAAEANRIAVEHARAEAAHIAAEANRLAVEQRAVQRSQKLALLEKIRLVKATPLPPLWYPLLSYHQSSTQHLYHQQSTLHGLILKTV